MERDWPAADVLPLLALIEDSRNIVADDGTVRLTEEQARGILELRLQRLTGLEREKINAEMGEVATKHRRAAGDHRQPRPPHGGDARRAARRCAREIASPRMTEIVEGVADQDDESLIEPGQMVVTITRDGFIKRTPLETFRQQNRGGRGRSAAGDPRRRHRHPQLQRAHPSMGAVLLVRRQGVPREGVAPAGGRPDRARAARWSTCCPNSGRDTITTVLPLPQDETLWDSLHLVFATAQGNVRRNRLSDFRNVRAGGPDRHEARRGRPR